MNVDIIGNEDLFPNEGYEFPQHDNAKITLNSKTSAMFPLNRKINDKVKQTTKMTSQSISAAPNPVIDPVMPQVRSHRSKLIYETMVKTRSKQVDYNQQKREYDAEVKFAEDQEEIQQIALAKEKALRQKEKARQKMIDLRQTYKEQLADVEKWKQKERQAELDYERELKRQDKILRKEEEKKQQKLKEIAEQRREEFRKINDEILMRKANLREKEEEEEKRIQKENAEVQARNDARAAEDERRRFSMTKKREQVVELMSKELEKTRSNNDRVQQNAESAAAKATMAEVMALKEKHQHMYEERHNDWLNIQREKQARKRTGVKRPFPSRQQEIDADAYAAAQRKREAERVKQFQLAQIDQRKRMEKEEIENDIRQDEEMLRMAQEKFDRSLAQMQNLIPPELGITVPKYTVSKSFSTMH
ncbi:trichohyalin [Tritrichomonas foetus]|uniref:Trichohyalin n=1 Tax=Tritrichomonas foetus TaxID=1144522 RepID=A0A1J4J8D8_9EUKA|nr:trichohyalin [Tritrichomonas foetus]|eukprot:OHS93955.1 trichohyalin [Tritrichomonas foetus]